jgi:hypothetical protein
MYHYQGTKNRWDENEFIKLSIIVMVPYNSINLDYLSRNLHKSII